MHPPFFLLFSLKFWACKREMSHLISLLFALQPLSVPVEPKRSESRRMTDASRLNKTNRRQEAAVLNGVTCSWVVPIDHVEEWECKITGEGWGGGNTALLAFCSSGVYLQICLCITLRGWELKDRHQFVRRNQTCICPEKMSHVKSFKSLLFPLAPGLVAFFFFKVKSH